MPKQLPGLGHRAIIRYNRLAKEIGALNYQLRAGKASGAVSPFTITTLNHLIRHANALFKSHADLPRFGWIDPAGHFTWSDLALLVARLTAASLEFEERYAHLQGPN